ncbi:MAG: molybdate ABC transporter permease subunit [Treponema sp.]|jgi:molybdate transport system permease protein|nr:molybdate ABC transporter permease subunit [Treponema sp.]
MDWSPLYISLRAACGAMVFTFFFGVLLARWVSGLRGPGRAVADGILTLPMVLPPTVLGFFLLLIFGRNSPLGRFFLSLGARVVFSWQATVIAAAAVSLPLMYRTARGAFEQIDPALIAAARTLGLSEGVIFLRIMLPLSWPSVAAGAVLGFARALGEFGATLMLAGNIPGRTATIPVAIFFAAEGGRMDIALVWVLIMTGLSFAVILPVNLWGGRRI